jgi:hypothetical protein
MQPEKTLAAAQYAKWWAQKLALLLIFLTSQFKEAGRIEMESEIIFSMDQF